MRNEVFTPGKQPSEAKRNHGRNMIKSCWEKPGWKEWKRNQLSQQMSDQWHKPEFEEARKSRLEKIAAANAERANTRRICLPLARRGATTQDIRNIYPELNRGQINSLLGRLRGKEIIKRPTSEETRLTKSKTLLGKVWKSKERRYTQEQKNSSALARSLKDSGLVPDDTQGWDELERVFREHERQLSDGFTTDKLRLEVFAEAYRSFKKGDAGPLDHYLQLGETVDSNWFTTSLTTEEQFIRDRLPYNLSLPFNDWSPKTQDVINAIDKIRAPLTVRKAFFSYWAHFTVGDGDAKATVRQLGVPTEEFVRDMRTVRFMETDSDEWQVFEKIIDEHDLTGNKFYGFKLYRPKKKEA